MQKDTSDMYKATSFILQKDIPMYDNMSWRLRFFLWFHLISIMITYIVARSRTKCLFLILLFHKFIWIDCVAKRRVECFYNFTFIFPVHDVLLLIIILHSTWLTAATTQHIAFFALFVDNMIIYCPMGLDVGRTLSYNVLCSLPIFPLN